MEKSSELKKLSSHSFFRKFSTAMTFPILLASSTLTSAAQANDLTARGAAFQQFKIDNPELLGKVLHHSFKEHWHDLRDVGTQGVNQAAASHAVQNAVPDVRTSQHLHTNDFASKAEFQAYKADLKQQNALNHINNSIQQTDTNRIINANQGFSLDLTSAAESITLGHNLFKQQESISINVGGQEKILEAGSKVTAAEYVAAKQALIGGGQSVTLDASGRATGGSVDLSAMTTGNHNMKVDDLVVPVDVTASGNFSKGGDVKIQGDLVNSGSINAFAEGGKVNAWISADNITNNLGASINSTVSDLTLSADNAFNNYGSISATGNLTVAAVGSLTNTGSISAHQHLNVFSPSVTNSGTLASAKSDVTFDAVASNMNVNNTGGTISALNGAINIREAGYEEVFNSTVTGGDLLSKQLNVTTGAGAADVFVEQLTGVVNSSGTAAHVSANTDVLTIGKQCLIGDPTYFNTGDIVLNGDIVVGETLAIIAGGSITATANLSQITARTAAGQGFDIIMIAGANITGSPTGQTPNPLPGQTTTPPNISGNATSSVTFDGPSALGGNIDLSSANSNLTINSNSTIAGGAGGNITIAAFRNGGSGGTILLPTNSTINASGNGSLNGNVTVLGGASVAIGSINTSSGTTGGIVTIASAQPVSSDGLQITFNTTGAITTGNKLFSSSVFGTGAVSVQDISAGTSNDPFDGTTISILSAGAILAGTLSTVGLDIEVNNLLTSAPVSVTITSVNSGGALSVRSAGDIFVTGALTAAGSIRIDNSVVASKSINVSGNVNAGAFGAQFDTGAFGSITFYSTSISAFDISFATGSLSFSQINTLSAGNDINGNAGSVNVVASSIFTTSGHLSLNAIGTGTGNGGLASLSSQATSSVNVAAVGSMFSFDVSAQGAGNGGSAVLDWAGNVTLDAGGIVGTGGGNGGKLTVRSNGSIDANANSINIQGANGDGAELTLKAGQDGSGFLNLNSTGLLLQANATGADHNGGKLDLGAETIFFPAAHLTLQAVGTGNGDGGSASLSLTDLAAVNLSSTGGLTFSFDVSAPGSGKGGTATGDFVGDVTINAGAIVGTGASGGGAIISTKGNITYQAGGINVQGSSGDGALLSLNAGTDGIGSLILNDTAFLTQAKATGANGNGGAIVLSAPTAIQYFNTLLFPLVLNADGIGNGDGGFVSYRTNNIAQTFVIDPNSIIQAPRPPVNFLLLSAKSGATGGNGGGIDVSVGGNLTVDPLFMTAGPQSGVGDWDGALYSLQSGTGGTRGGTLIVKGPLSANAVNNGLGGAISLASRSGTAFSVKSAVAPKNGIFGSVSATGSTGFISISNDLGNVLVAQNGATNANSVMLSTGIKGSITAGVGVQISAGTDLTLLAGSKGSIGGKALVSVSAPDLLAQAGGTVGLSVTSSSTVTVHDSFAGKGFTLVSAKPTTLLDIAVAKGSILITQNGTGLLEVADAGSLTAVDGGITLQNNDTLTGSIRIGKMATVQTLGRGKPVNISFGVAPRTGTNPVPPGSEPSGIDVVTSGRGVVFLGAAGTVTSEGPGIAKVEAKNVNVIFNSVNNRPIVLGENSYILADPPLHPVAVAQSSVDTLASTTRSANSTTFALSDNSAFASALSPLSLTNPSANNPTLMTASNAALLSTGITAMQTDDDDSYAVGYCKTTGETDGAICSDSPIVASWIAGTSSVRSIQHSERVSVNSGNVLFVPFKDTVVETPAGIVKVGAKAVVLVSVSPAGLAVYDFDDQHKGSVVIESNGHNILLSPGRHAMITAHHQAEFAQVNAIESIAHRNLSSALKNGSRAHTSEFSVISAMDTVKPVKAMVRSLHPKGKAAAEHMMKTSAIILQLAKGGEYQHYFKPRLTAMK